MSESTSLENRKKNGTGLTHGEGLKNGKALTDIDGKWELLEDMRLKRKQKSWRFWRGR